MEARRDKQTEQNTPMMKEMEQGERINANVHCPLGASPKNLTIYHLMEYTISRQGYLIGGDSATSLLPRTREIHQDFKKLH